jgi:uncharacterized protein YdhG (YjbR/CyaY superfamily)
MEGNEAAPETVDEYIAKFPPEIQEILGRIRKVIKETAPDAEEKISYRMPAYLLHGNLVYFAAYKNHIGFYLSTNEIDVFKHELSEYKVLKGTIQFPVKKPVPYELISRIVEFRAAENIKKAESK